MKRVLVIDDEQEILTTITNFLKGLGYDVVSASNGLDGIRQVASGDFDLVITDIVMPYVSGIGIVSMVKKKQENVPVIVMTGYGEEPEKIAQEKAADIVLRKPFTMATLKDHISRLLPEI